jgi:1-deoxy-D-xylulose-5-phosphate reductoisomerase
MKKKVTILGSTGAIGRKAISFLEQHLEEFEVIGLTAGENSELLIDQAEFIRPKFIALKTTEDWVTIEKRLSALGIECYFGDKGILEVAAKKVDISLAAISGFSGLLPTIFAIRAGNNIALANKESLVCAGQLFINEARKYNAYIIPVDSEHNGLFQIFDQKIQHFVKNIYLTCSGGPFRNLAKEEFSKITVSQALNHPRWQMGKKITIDSATLVNKALEKIEAFHLFGLKQNQIKIIIHPESIIHGLVTYIDGGMTAQLSNTDMIIPISYALSWPDRKTNGINEIDFEKISSFTFQKPDIEKFPSLRLVEEVLQEKPSAALIFNSANEVAVEAFLKEKIRFIDITSIIAEALNTIPASDISSIEEIMNLDIEIREYCLEMIKKRGINV